MVLEYRTAEAQSLKASSSSIDREQKIETDPCVHWEIHSQRHIVKETIHDYAMNEETVAMIVPSTIGEAFDHPEQSRGTTLFLRNPGFRCAPRRVTGSRLRGELPTQSTVTQMDRACNELLREIPSEIRISV